MVYDPVNQSLFLIEPATATILFRTTLAHRLVNPIVLTSVLHAFELKVSMFADIAILLQTFDV